MANGPVSHAWLLGATDGDGDGDDRHRAAAAPSPARPRGFVAAQVGRHRQRPGGRAAGGAHLPVPDAARRQPPQNGDGAGLCHWRGGRVGRAGRLRHRLAVPARRGAGAPEGADAHRAGAGDFLGKQSGAARGRSAERDPHGHGAGEHETGGARSPAGVARKPDGAAAFGAVHRHSDAAGGQPAGPAGLAHGRPSCWWCCLWCGR